MASGKIDRTLFASFIILGLTGFTIFISASLGLLARDGADFITVALKQAIIGFLLGSIFLYIYSFILSVTF